MFKKIAFFALFLAVTGLFAATSVNAQRLIKGGLVKSVQATDTLIEPIPEVIKFTPAQCANGGVGDPANNCGYNADGVTPSDANWEKGNMNGQKAHYPEGSNIHYQYVFTGLSPNTQYTFRIGYDAWEGVYAAGSTAHTIDYLNTYNAGFDGAPLTEYKVNPCGGVAGCVLANSAQIAIPSDTTFAGATQPAAPRYFTGWGLTWDSATFLVPANPLAGERIYEIKFTTGAGVSTAVVAWSGHIAKGSEWAAIQPGDTGAGGQSGSPYHMRNAGNGSFGDGQQELQLQASAVVPVPAVKAFKTVRLGRQEGDDLFTPGVINLQDTVVWTIRYINTSTVNIPNFQIQDTINPGLLYVGPLVANSVKLNPLTVALVPTNPLFDGTTDVNMLGPNVTLEAGMMITVRFRTRVVLAGPIPNQAFGSGGGIPIAVSTDSADDGRLESISGFAVSGECVEAGDDGPAGGCYPQTVWVSPAGYAAAIEPTYIDTLAGPTAAAVSITGRVTDYYGRAISSAKLTLFGASGEAKVVYTNTFGYYKFSEVPVADFYVMSVQHRRYTFVNGSVNFSLQDNIEGFNFQASR